MSVPSLLQEWQYNGSIPYDDLDQSWIFRIPSSLPSPEEVVIFREGLDNVYDTLDTLSVKDIDVFMMKYFDDCKISEISKDCNLTRSKVETSVNNTMKNIRKTLQMRGQL